MADSSSLFGSIGLKTINKPVLSVHVKVIEICKLYIIYVIFKCMLPFSIFQIA